jgi:4-hydroxyphenylpyruvate dioxygenase
MGPFPHDAPPAAITPENPMGTDGSAFVEFAHPEPLQLHRLFRLMGFAKVARHRSKEITVYRQGDVDYLVNEEPNTQAARFAVLHGPCAASMGFRVVDAAHAYRRAVSLGAEPPDPERGLQVLEVPAIKGIGGSLLY